MRQPTAGLRDTLFAMAEKTQILNVERDGEEGLIVTFSDGTTGAYVAEELLELRPFREQTQTLKNQNLPKTL
jgi:hypothetical protein